MKPRHAAALALIGWYLMTPPALTGASTLGAPVYTDVDAPISKWNIVESFDSARACQDSIKKQLASIQKHPEGCDTVGGQVCRGYTMAKCIATDDPRLKEK
jgi:hypothetical protein